MKKLGIVVVIVVMLLGTSTLAGINAPVLEDAKGKHNETNVFSINFSPPKIKENQEYTLIESDMAYLMNEDFPILPYKTEVMTFPFGTKIENVEVTTSEIHTMQLDRKIQPAPKPISHNMENADTKITEGTVYQSTELYPLDWISYNIGAGRDSDGHNIFLSIQAFPCRYIPASNELMYTNKMEIKVTYEPSEKPLLQNDVYDLLIVAPSEFSDALQPLVNHKETYGVATKLVTLSEIYGGTYFTVNGRDDAEKVKYFIKDAVEQWGIKYVLLVGGRHGGVKEFKWWCPVRYSYLDVNDGDKFFLSDLYFSDIYKYDDGNIVFEDWDSNGNGIFGEWRFGGKDVLDWYPDVYVGRLACRNKFEVDIMVEKIITYETTAYGESWSKKYVGIGGDSFAGDQYYDGELAVLAAADYLKDVGFEISTLFTSDNTLTEGKDIIDAVSEGCGFLDFEGHGNPMSWATHPPLDESVWIGIDEAQFMLFKNKDMYPICLIGGCSNSKFDISLLNLLDFENLSAIINHASFGPECFSWWLTRKIDGGAIATIGCTSYGPARTGDANGNGIPDCIEYYGYRIDIEFFRLYTEEEKDILGETHGAAISYYLTEFPMTDKKDGKTIEEWCLLGDPSLKIGGYP